MSLPFVLFLLTFAEPRVGYVFDVPESAASVEAQTWPMYAKMLVGTRAGSDGEAHLARARQACQSAFSAALALETQAALKRFEEAVELYFRAMPALQSMDELVTCSLEHGAAAADGRLSAIARDAFRRALIMNPKVQLDPVRYTPTATKLFRTAAAELESARRGSLTIAGEPAGAEVTMDGRVAGRLPMSVADVVPGEHWLLVRAPGRVSFTTRVTVEERKAGRIDVFLLEEAQRSDLDRVLEILSADRPLSPEHSAALSSHAATEGVDALVHVRPKDGRHAIRVFDARTGRITERSVSLGGEERDAFLRRVLDAQTPASAVTHTLAPKGVSSVHPIVSLLPFGIGQFAERRPVPGALFLASQMALLATNLACVAVIYASRRPDGTHENGATAEALKWTINISFALLIADIIVGAIDGLLHRHVSPAPSSPEDRRPSSTNTRSD
jgi:hypothetical protein